MRPVDLRPVRAPVAVAARGSAPAVVAGVVRACRPRQWLKNLLVLAAPGAAGVLATPRGAGQTVVALACFCLAASAAYLVNDVADAERDRLHPRKRHRPVAAGVVPAQLAGSLAGLLGLAAPALALLAGWRLAVVVLCYLALTLAYTFWLKHVEVFDLLGVTGGFVLRAVGGAAAVDVPISSWFYIVVSLGALFVVTGKRAAELRRAEASQTRATLATYSRGYLSYIQAMSSGAVVVTYSMWVFQLHDGAELAIFSLSIIPFVAGLLRYALLVDIGEGETPEELLLRDRWLQATGVVLVGLLGIGIYTT